VHLPQVAELAVVEKTPAEPVRQVVVELLLSDTQLYQMTHNRLI
jgi:hypothetical protein